MASPERPKLRPLQAKAVDHEGKQYVALNDPLGVASGTIMIPLEGFQWIVRHFDGQTTLLDIQAHVLRSTGQFLGLSDIEKLVDQLEQAMYLEGPTFSAFLDEYRATHLRPAAQAGRSYLGSERALRAQLGQFFFEPKGAGLPRPSSDAARDGLRGVISPHIDFQRGGAVYTWAYRELMERTDADVFVILGVAHQPTRQRFVLTYKDFETPLGLARTDRRFVEEIARVTGNHLFEDELVHRNEHSIEFQVVFLQFVLGERRPFSIVPILVGSFQDLLMSGVDPIEDPEVRRFIDALRDSEQRSGKKVAYIGGIDLAHVGPEFDDPGLVSDHILHEVRGFDSAMLGHAQAVNPARWFGTAADVSNRWRVCGLAATYTMLHAMGPSQGRLLKYDQAVNPERTCCVSFASLAFDAL